MQKKGVRIINMFLAGLFYLALCFAPSVKVFAHFAVFKIIVDGKEFCYYPPQLDYSLSGANLLGLDGIIEDIVLSTKTPAKDAVLIFNPQNEENPFEIVKEKSGKIVNEKKLRARIEFALDSGKNTVKINTENYLPQITYETLKKQTFLRAEFSTAYPYSSNERKNNIALAVSFINGAKIEPNQTFSFNERVGIRSEERGFLNAKVILEGQFTDGVGGGVCQVSSTLYNAVLKAGLKVKESHQHSLAVDYVQPSFDAMVSDFFADLKFVNVCDFPVYILGKADGQKITFKIYGEQTKFRYELVSCVNEIIEAKNTVVKRQSNDEVNVRPKNGLKSEGYLYVYQGDTLLEVKRLRKDSYKAVDGITYVEEE